MNNKIKIGIIICDRYVRCAGGKCLRAMRNKEGAFSKYDGKDIELIGYTICDGCPGGNIEYFHDFIKSNHLIDVVYGTHPIPQKYLEKHRFLGVSEDIDWNKIVKPILANEEIRIAYN